MKKYLVILLMTITYFTSGGCNAKAANAMPVEIYYFTITNDISKYIKNLTPAEGTAMPIDRFEFAFDIEPLSPGGYIPTPEIKCLVGVMTVTTAPLEDREGNHINIKIEKLEPGQKITIKVDDK